jgi:hypothetical protein
MTILYVNGCSHTAAAEAEVPHCFAEDDPKLYHLGRKPHPLNLAASWCTKVSQELNATLHCDAESASSNDRIIRTTKDWVENNSSLAKNTFAVIQWTTWEREEWLHSDGTHYQVNASGVDSVPPEWADRYRQYILDVDWHTKTIEAHEKIWELHNYLNQHQIKHLFFNGVSTFSDIPQNSMFDWNNAYIDPYSRDGSYYNHCLLKGFREKTHGFYHLGKDAHAYWADFVLYYVNSYNLIGNNEISTN